MKKNPEIMPNHVASTLFVGVGGIGSKIVKRVADLAVNDDLSKVRFVSLDTDVNSLEGLEKDGVRISSIQTSSPRTVADYLIDDKATVNWFPENRILDDKTVSEGAGQVRAISRLALNATIKNGRISTLYKAIDDLFLKDGNDKNQAIKVVIVSTAAGGTGSGIAMIIAMLIRKYMKANYPESAAIIRGFLILPGVMDTVIKNESERQSLRRNGYATIKEINAFMMKGSGFFESEPKLRRYQDLHIEVPTTGGGFEKLDTLPFDFCFLVDRTDEIQRSMEGLDQYRENIALSIYEQNIGSMRHSASSKEDNVIREFIRPDKYGACRFGGAGASVLVYPYEQIREYIALDWVQKLLFGSMEEDMTDEERLAAVNESWLKYDVKFETELKTWEKNPNSGAKDKPSRDRTYISSIEVEENDPFTESLREFQLKSKLKSVPKDAKGLGRGFQSDMTVVVDHYLDEVKTKIIDDVRGHFGVTGSVLKRAMNETDSEFISRYTSIEKINAINEAKIRTEETVKSYTRGIFNSPDSVSKKDLPGYMLQKFLSVDGNALHPNVMRYLLYKLRIALKELREETNVDLAAYKDKVENITLGDLTEDGSRDNEIFKIKFNGDDEHSLREMCEALDDGVKFQESKKDDCNDLLKNYYKAATSYNENFITHIVCDVALVYIEEIIETFEKFYNSFKEKAVSIAKRKENISKSLRFSKGDTVWNLFDKEENLKMLAKQMSNNVSGSKDETDMFAKIYDTIKVNAAIEQRNKFNKYSDEVPADVFESCMISTFLDIVEKVKGEDINVDILHAIKLEHKITCDIKKDKAPTEDKRTEISKLAKSQAQINRYIIERIKECENLSKSGISKMGFEESRAVEARAYSIYVKDGDGLRVADFLKEESATDTVSKYEIHFFSSVYVITPPEIAKLAPPVIRNPEIDIIRDERLMESAGECFKNYQSYMEDIGPDSRLTPVITPHIDKRWNSISVMPEIDLGFQDILMKHIHKAFFYGLVFGIIARYTPSILDKDRTAYRYRDGGNGYKELIVSNGTKCDKLYEVLDALYFDRAAVKSIHNAVMEYRKTDKQNAKAYSKTKFSECIEAFSKCDFGECGSSANVVESNVEEGIKTSVFELPVIYYNSLPHELRDFSEIKTMVEAIFEAVKDEIKSFNTKNNVDAAMALFIEKHYRVLIAHYSDYITDDADSVVDVFAIIRKTLEDKLVALDCTRNTLADIG